MNPRGNEATPLLKLLNERKSWDMPEWKGAPHYPDNLVHNAASLYAQAHSSDPFAYRRMRKDIAMGYENPYEVAKENEAALLRHRNAMVAHHSATAKERHKVASKWAKPQRRAA